MKDKWLKDLHDRMSEFEMDSPDNLWDEIEAIEVSRQRKPVPVIPVWGKRLLAVAAVVAIVLSVAYYPRTLIPDLSQVAGIGLRYCDASSLPAEIEDTVDEVGTDTGDTGNVMAVASNAVATHADDAVPVHAVEVSESIEDLDADSAVESSDNVSGSDTEKSPEVTYPSVRSGRTHNLIAFTSHNEAGHSRVSVGVYSSGGMGANVMNNSLGSGPIAVGADNVRWEGRPMLGILLCNQGKEITTDIKHRQPVRAGVSFTYGLTDRLGIGSGLSYTHLSSDLKSGTDTHYFSGEQTLHYVGVPLTASYSIVRWWKRFHVYASGGILVEKCVSGKVNWGYVHDNNTMEAESKGIDEKPWQFSVNASAGVQFDFTNSVGIYAEPGVSYYFNDGSGIDNIYKEKPFNLNLNVGVRFTFGE